MSYTITPLVNNVKYYIYNKNDCIQGTLLAGNQWNAQAVTLMKGYIATKKLHHFLNVGSHIGSVCLPISLYINKTTAIEAYPETYKHLCKNIELNNIKNINTFNVAVGNSNEDVYFMGNDMST